MVLHLLPPEKVNTENAGSYAGLVASSFMIGRSLSSYLWGRIADRVGRKPVILCSLALSAAFSLGFGTAESFEAALVIRFLLGLSNGLIGTVKTLVSELANGDEVLETKSMGLVIGMWGWGFLFSPAVSGALSEPTKQYPDNAVVKSFEGMLGRYPFLLPNLVAAVLCGIVCVTTVLYVEETLPAEKRMRVSKMLSGLLSKLLKRIGMVFTGVKAKHREETLPLQQPLSDTKVNCYTDNKREQQTSSKQQQQRQPTSASSSLPSIWSRQSTRRHLFIYWIYSFVTICLDESFPLFCLSHSAGLSLEEASIGKILSGAGLVFAICQYFVYTKIVERWGLFNSLKIGSLCGNTAVVLIPFGVLINRYFPPSTSDSGRELSRAAYVYLVFVMATIKVFGSVFFSSMTIALNRTVPVSQRGTMNGISMMGGSVAKGLGPIFAGALVAFSLSGGVFQSGAIGGWVIFGVLGLLASFVAVGVFLYLGDEESQLQHRSSKEEQDENSRG